MIRDATIEDIPKMAELWLSMLKETNADVEPNAEGWANNQMEMMGNKAEFGIHYYPYVAVVDGKMVGLIIGILYADPTTNQNVAYGQDFYVIPGQRNKQISEGLYGRLVRMGKSLKADCIEMTCFEGQIDFWSGKGYNVQKYCIRRSM